MVNILETYDLSKNYGKHKVIDTVNMHVPHGSIYGFVGENGAGKTTIMRLITGLAMPTSGTYALNGKTNKSKDIYQEKKKMSAIVETTSLVPTMNALDNLKFAMKYLGINDEELPHKLLKTVGLDNVGNKKVKNFSLGMKQRLGIALSLIGEPNFMLLDEPMNGLDPEGIVELRNLIIKLNQEKGITFIISSHILSELEKVATHYGFISHGKLLKEITADQLKNAFRKSIDISVNEIEKTNKLFKELNLDYSLEPNHIFRIYSDISLNDLLKHLVNNNITIIDIQKQDESVEDYYLKVIRGEE